jgi:hypothetical protein
MFFRLSQRRFTCNFDELVPETLQSRAKGRGHIQVAHTHVAHDVQAVLFEVVAEVEHRHPHVHEVVLGLELETIIRAGTGAGTGTAAATGTSSHVGCCAAAACAAAVVIQIGQEQNGGAPKLGVGFPLVEVQEHFADLVENRVQNRKADLTCLFT